MTSETTDLLGDAAPYIDVVELAAADVPGWWSSLQSAAERQRPGAVLRLIEGGKCTTADGLFDAVALALNFPDHFGRNWSAFEDCVNDLGWLLAPAYIVVVDEADLLLSATSDRNLTVLDSILNAKSTAVASPGEEVVPLRFVLVTAHPSELARRLDDAGAHFSIAAA